MNTSKPWDHLPNAKHIDRFIASVDRYPNIWNSAWYKWDDLASDELQDQAWVEAKAKCKEMGRWGVWAEDAATGIGSILALIAYDDCAHYLDMSSQELTTIALLGVAPAVLLLPAVMHFEEIAKISH